MNEDESSANSLTNFMETDYFDPEKESLIEKQLDKETEKKVRIMQVIEYAFKVFLVIMLLGCGGIFLYFILKPHQLEQFLTWISGIGIWGYVILIICFVLVCFPFAVGFTVLALVCGFLYKLWKGYLIMFVGINVLGCSLSYLVCKTIARSWIESFIHKRKKMTLFLNLTRSHGFKIVFVSRFTPIPFGFQNAVFGVSGIPFWKYWIATALGTAPEEVMWIYLGSTLRKVTEIVSGHSSFGTTEKIILSVEIVAIFLIFVFFAWIGRKVMKQSEKEDEEKRRKEEPTQIDEQNF